MTYPLDSLRSLTEFNYQYLKALVSDVPVHLMANQPAKGLENHPAFTIGHLITAYHLVMKRLEIESGMPSTYMEMFARKGPGDPTTPTDQIEDYPSREELLRELDSIHQEFISGLPQVPESKWGEEVTWKFTRYFPTVMDMTYFMMVTHYSMHISQLAAWRRAHDLGSALKHM